MSFLWKLFKIRSNHEELFLEIATPKNMNKILEITYEGVHA